MIVHTAGRTSWLAYGITVWVDRYSLIIHIGIMKTTVDIPDQELADAIRFMNAKTKREAIVGAIMYFNRRMRMAELTRFGGTCPDLVTPEEVQAARRRS